MSSGSSLSAAPVDVVIWDSVVMMDYLDRQYVPGGLIPDDPAREAAYPTSFISTEENRLTG
jgi:glutathione S-transferase